MCVNLFNIRCCVLCTNKRSYHSRRLTIDHRELGDGRVNSLDLFYQLQQITALKSEAHNCCIGYQTV